MTDREAIDALQYMISGDCTDMQMDYTDEIELGISALTERMERESGCKYCTDKNGIFCEGQDTEVEAFNYADDNAYIVYPNYCPMCGRKLAQPPKEENNAL